MKLYISHMNIMCCTCEHSNVTLNIGILPPFLNRGSIMVVTNIEHLSTRSVDNSKRSEQQTKANVQSRKVPLVSLYMKYTIKEPQYLGRIQVISTSPRLQTPYVMVRKLSSGFEVVLLHLSSLASCPLQALDILR